MVGRQVLDHDSLVVYLVSERPDAVVCGNCVVGEVKVGLGSYITPENGVALIFDIILFVAFFIRIYLRISEVDSKVEVVGVADFHVIIDLLGRSAGLLRVGRIVAD